MEKCLSKFTPLPHWGSTTTLGNCALLARCLAIFQQFSLKIWFFQCRLFSNEKPLPVSSDLLRLFQKCTCPLCVKPFIFPAIIMLFAPLLTFNHHQYNEMMSLTDRGPPCLPFLRIQGKFPPRALHRPSRWVWPGLQRTCGTWKNKKNKGRRQNETFLGLNPNWDLGLWFQNYC